MRARTVLVPMLGLLVCACGNKRNETAAAACNKEIANRLAGKSYEIDVGDLARHVKTESTGTLLLSSTVVFDKGLSSQYQQTYDCRVRIDPAGNASVLYLQFNWNTSDLKQAQ